MEGFIALHRKMIEWEWYTDTNVKAVFLHCLLKANYDRKEWRGVMIERGEFITSVASLSSELDLSAMQVRRALNCLQSTSEITIKTTNKYSVIKVCNYESYQNIGTDAQQTKQQTRQQSNNNQTTIKQQQHNNNNNNNNITIIESNTDVLPNDKPKSKFQKPTIEEIQRYCDERGNGVDAERFFAYYEANGWKVGRNAMKDWRAAVRTWETKDGKPKSQPKSQPLFDDRAEVERIQREARETAQRRRAQQEQELEDARQADIHRIENIIFNNN